MSKINKSEFAKILGEMNEIVLIQINKKDKIKGFYILLNYNMTALPDEIYNVPRQALYALKAKGIKFKEIKHCITKQKVGKK